MDLKSTKLKIINQVLQSKDPRLLQTVLQLLEIEDTSEFTASPPPEPFSLPKANPSTPLSREASEMQESIDELFEGKKP